MLVWLITIFGCVERQLARPTPQMDIEQRFWVRVLVLDDVSGCMLKSATSFTVSDSDSQARFYQPNAPVNISISGAEISIAGRSFRGNEVIIAPDSPHIFNLNGDEYRGKLKLIVNSDGDRFDAVNLVPLEPYLAGVIGAEMPDYWEPSALQAQSIAARTYCLYIKNRFGSNRHWDVRPTAANQVYLGVKAESGRVWGAVNQTQGQVLVCRKDEADMQYEIFPAYYSSTCGGHTENSSKVFGDSFAPLVGVACPYCKNVAKPSFFFWPMVQFDKKDVTNKVLRNYPKLKSLGEIKNITPAKQSKYGNFSRLTLVKLTGSSGESGFLRAEDLRLTIDPTGNKLRSTICQIVNMAGAWAFLSGRGYGHGVGMCQCGAQGMAREGKNAAEILFYYYPGSKIVSVY